ncbi:hypothetical protein SEA_MEMENTOMORI_71 [Microbacterium phage MementoMori]|uniref:Uncharacterized protein n=1 Tax=Microbacterium phage MementoMori TaxID=2201436 RepID=A0A2Z4Q5X9_9CAUD|nr:hypothetical protein HOT41_gp38 [Microbacterium phage MementoMori]AWY05325.1 hypothetical protein SEA_MEMENTOMORI_71 [Microbacterium phage MementoMori]
MTGYTIDRAPEREPRRIDYERMNREWPGQKRRLAAAVETGDPVKVAEVCIDAVKVWDEIGAWPDDWSAFQRALDDVLPWNQGVDLSDVAYGRTTIKAAP